MKHSILGTILMASGTLAALGFATPCAAQAARTAFVVSADAGGMPQVRVFDGALSSRDFLAYAPTYSGGVRVAVGDIDGDAVDDIIVAPGPGGGTNVRVFSGVDTTLIRDFLAFGPTFLGGVHVAAGDVDGDGRVDIVAGAGEGGTALRVFSGRTLLPIRDFAPFGTGFSGGIRVASGDVNGDGWAEVIVGAGPGAAPEVRVFDGRGGASLATFNAYAPTFTGGIFVAAGDIDGDGRADIITGVDEGAAPQVKAFRSNDQVELANFFAYSPSFTGGVRVAAADLDGDGDDEIITGAGPGGPPQVNLYTGAMPTTFNAFSAGFTGGVYVAGPVDTVKLLRDGFE